MTSTTSSWDVAVSFVLQRSDGPPLPARDSIVLKLVVANAVRSYTACRVPCGACHTSQAICRKPYVACHICRMPWDACRASRAARRVPRAQVQSGADVEWLSVNPGEHEVIFPPLVSPQPL